jgi:hypothetical protein
MRASIGNGAGRSFRHSKLVAVNTPIGIVARQRFKEKGMKSAQEVPDAFDVPLGERDHRRSRGDERSGRG